MIVNVFLNSIIIALWLVVGAMSFNFYVSNTENHFQFKSLFSLSSAQILGCIMAYPYILGVTDRFQYARMILFSIMEIMILNFLLRTTSIRRPWELVLTSVFMVIILFSTIYNSLLFNILITAILFYVALKSSEYVIRKYYSISMATYFLVSVIPAIFGFTGTQSLAIGAIFSWTFLFASYKIYKKERINDKLVEMVKSGEL